MSIEADNSCTRVPVLKNWKTDGSTAHPATLGRYLDYAANFAVSLKQQSTEHYIFGQCRIRAGYPMVNFIALYISVGIIASLVVGAPVWWWQFRSERQKTEQFAPDREELETIRPQVVELRNVRRELRGVMRERDAFSAIARDNRLNFRDTNNVNGIATQREHNFELRVTDRKT